MNNTVNKEKLFTKSAFKIALECPNKLYYYRNPDVYANADAEDEFLQALAEGGFQVGELAKIYCDVPPENDIKEKDYAGSLARTQELMQQEQVNISEAAFRYDNLFVRVDILKRDGNQIELIEVKAKSWNPENKFEGSRPKGCVQSGIRAYVYDVAFQKYVVTHALKEQYPDKHFTVKARLMMADKSMIADINGLNQLFKIKKDKRGQTIVETADDAHVRLAKSNTRVLTAFDVDKLCDRVIAGKTSEQGKEDFMLGWKFKDYVKAMSKYYCDNKPFPDITLSPKCFKCQFQSDGSTPGLKDGYKECWRKAAKFTDSDFDEPLLKDLWAGSLSTKRNKWIKDCVYKMSDITEDLLGRHTGEAHPGLDHLERKWLQIAMMTENRELLNDFASDICEGVYLDIDGLKSEMAKWKYPLHMIDFETTTVALPYYEGMRPYESIAFQFSHHIIEQTSDGSYTIRHAGQYLNEDVTKFPNFEFVRALREQLSHDDGTIFRYSPHENTILNAIRWQLEERGERDKDVLIAFIDEITHDSDAEREGGPRDMVDLLDVVKRYFYEPKEMRGSNSIKVVLPAVLNASQFLKDKYSKPIYGKAIPSCNISVTQPLAWIEFDVSGHVDNPYHLLPSVSEILKLDGVTDDILERENDDMTVANGGAALTAYNKLMFSDSNTDQAKALRKAMLRYCELDTMAMVFIWEYFNHEIKLQRI